LGTGEDEVKKREVRASLSREKVRERREKVRERREFANDIKPVHTPNYKVN